MIKKDVDVRAKVLNGIIKAREHYWPKNIIKEEVTKFNRDKFTFDREKDIGIVEFKPKEWGTKGTVGAEVLDKVLENIIPIGEPDPIKRFKASLIKINEVTGTKFGKTGMLQTRPESISDLKTVFSTLQMSALFTSIINNNDPSVAGKIFEGLIARMLGGYATNRDDVAIEDIRTQTDKGEQFVSLKVIDRDTKITGSKLNLALGIVSGQNPAQAVTYLVCVKDSKNNPLYFKPFTFSINKNNFFNFICNKGKIQKSDIQKEAYGILSRFSETVANQFNQKFSLSENKIRINEASESAITPASVMAAIKLFVDKNLSKDFETAKLQMDDENTATKFVFTNHVNRLVEDALNSTKEQVYPGKTLYDIFIGSKEEQGFLPGFDKIKDLVEISRIDKKYPFDSEIFKNILTSIKDTKYNAQELGKYFDPNIENRNYLKKDFDSLEPNERQIVTDILKENSKSYRDSYNKFVLKNKSLLRLLEFLDEFSDVLDRSRGLKKYDTIEGESSLKTNEAMVTEFFNLLKPENKGPIAKGTKGEGRFEIAISSAKSIAAAVEGDLDEDFQEVLIELRDTFQLAEENSKVLEQYAVPLFKAVHELKVDLIQYYGYGELEGLTLMPSHADDVKKQVQNQPQQQPSQINAPASQKRGNLGESLDKHLTKDWSQVMLDELLKQ